MMTLAEEDAGASAALNYAHDEGRGAHFGRGKLQLWLYLWSNLGRQPASDVDLERWTKQSRIGVMIAACPSVAGFA